MQTLLTIRPHAAKQRSRSSMRRVWGALTFPVTANPFQCSLCDASAGANTLRIIGAV